ncbi:glutathione S-transferase family protein [Hyphomicrobium sp. CS1BSMeth3]|uniref:glutathione S-transferase family protein n=1 Tax=Hyphomicrobium sp. CS1BSMeth3 TaxID=1892844 RepID=UPI000930A396|nr:glutathione S-transferase family protein [Hyphomicrobium sp. CS1BSMeth3]
MKLIGRYDSPYVRRVGVALHVLALPFEHVPLSPFSQAAEFRRFAPVGRMPALVLDDGETLIESAAILDHLDEIAGHTRALIPSMGAPRRRALRILGSATAACDKAIAINYERRRPAHLIHADWIDRCRMQLDAALQELEAFRLELADMQPLMQTEITAVCAYAYIRRVEPDAVSGARYSWLDRLSGACEARPEFKACPQ